MSLFRFIYNYQLVKFFMRTILFFLTVTFSFYANAQSVYITENKYDADFKVYVTSNKYEADWIVYITNKKMT